jgi:hypothetical protein
LLVTHKILLTVLIASFSGSLLAIPYAFGEESKSPLQAVWDAIYDLQDKNDDLQAQIDDLRAERASVNQVDEPISELSAKISISGISHDSGEVKIGSVVTNDGPDQATGVRLTLFYKMPLFKVTSIEGDECRNIERGIIQCDLGTIEAGEQVSISVDVSPLEGRVPTFLTADVSSTTTDRIPGNNHIVVDYVTGSGAEKNFEEIPAADYRTDPSETDSGQNATSTNNSHEDERSEPVPEQAQNNQASGNNNQTSDGSSSNEDTSADTGQQYQDGDNNNQNQESTEEGDSDQTSDDSSDASDSPGDEDEDNESQSGENNTTRNQTSTTGEAG